MRTQKDLSSIGKYRITDVVGEGAMGVVYRAVDTVLDRPVAIKVMAESIAQQEDLRRRFLREAQAAGSLQHPNIVTVHDFGDIDGSLFIAMEFIDGVDLEQLIARREPLSVQTGIDIIIDVLAGLGYAHKRGIVHRDIKPANIRLGEGGRAKLMDFGIAHLTSSRMTSTGSILGTPSYMAPEQITEGTASPASDIFAVGAVLYHLLTLLKPFDGSNTQNLLFRIVTEHPRPLRELRPELPASLGQVVERAMAKEPAHRYADAREMTNDLIRVGSSLDGAIGPVSTSPMKGQERSKRRGSRARHVAYLGGGVVAATGIAAIAYSQLGRPSKEVEPVHNRTQVVTESSPSVRSLAPLDSARPDIAVIQPTPTQRITTLKQPRNTPIAEPPSTEATPDPRKELASIGVAWSTQGFIDALEASDARVVRLFLDGGMSPTVMHNGASAVLFILQPLLPNPIPMLKLMIEKGYDVNAILTDATIMRHYGSLPPYWTPPDLPNYSSFTRTFSGPALMWVAMRAAYAGPTQSDLEVIDFLRHHGADTRITERLLTAMESAWGDTPAYQKVRAKVTQ
ncbi:MAG TPA: serine/threonine-protein kinase [Gemmatimonadaceae bacterium]|nr:serine/threonine-protein kinase [Gemmatimonadaceae bacterium]